MRGAEGGGAGADGRRALTSRICDHLSSMLLPLLRQILQRPSIGSAMCVASTLAA